MSADTAKKKLSRDAQARHPATMVQAGAANPRRNAWVGASAGTGKTKVLIDRVLRLMLPRPALGDAPPAPATLPGRILCLTFTKTGAAEMSTRIYDRLAKWSVMDDADLTAGLAELTGAPPDVAMMAAARRLFAQVLDTPGGLKIMTIHSFCQSVLKRFPIEVGLPPHFVLMDEMTANDVLTQCLHNLISDARRHPDSSLAKAFTQLSLRLDAAGLTDILQTMMSARARFEVLLAQHGDSAGRATQTAAAVYARLGLAPGAVQDDIAAEFVRLHPEAQTALRQLAVAMIDHGTDTGQENGRLIADFLAEDAVGRAALLPSYLPVFITGKGTLQQRLVTKDVVSALPAAREIAAREFDRLSELSDRQRAIRLAEVTTALLTVAADMLARYAAVKKSRDALDFDDLILRTATLLSGKAQVQWVLYKLDEGLDHILVDEAQDTSPAQWDVVAALANEFLDGRGARDDITRTLFVVGDEKQSIFSFQGADPAAFHRMKAHFAERVANLQDGFAVDLEYSFRSTASVLGMVDAVFKQMDTKRGVVFAEDKAVVHLPYRAGQAGHVELWPLLTREEAAPRDPWQPATAVDQRDSALGRLVTQMADTIRGWLDRKEMLPARGRPIRPGDVLILVQSRSEIVERLMRALKANNIPVAGADRMKLRQEIAVMDVVAAARFALQPRDDLTLAALLKSPLVGVTEESLFALCYDRPQTLWSRLHDLRPDLVAWLQPLVATAGRATPYEFFASLLTVPCPGDPVSGRRAFYGRLGRDVADALDEFLNGCLAYEQAHVPALEAFVDWFSRLESDIKREQDAASIDQVRIMTVHASKGLQAPIVFLPDTTKISYDHNKARPRLLWPDGADPDDVPLWAPLKADEAPLFTTRYQAARQRQDEEYRRLLYVALTRAEDRLYIGGYQQGSRAIRPQCWYSLIEQAFAHIPADHNGVRSLTQAQEAPVTVEAPSAATDRPRDPLPDWATAMPAAEAALAKPLAPSRPDEDEPAVKSPLDGDDTARFARGNIMHRLLEVLPSLPAHRWDQAMRDYLARPAFALTPAVQASFATEIRAVLDHPDFAAIFGPQSRAEVPLVGLAGVETVLSGQIDRLVVTDDAVLVVDYKTNRPPPQNVADVPVIYRKQLAAYAAVLQRIYPGKTIKTALLWTDGPRLMPIPPEMLAPYLPKSG